MLSHSVMSNSLWPHGLLCPWDFPGKNAGVDCQLLLQEIFSTQGSNSRLLGFLRWQADSSPLVPPASFNSSVVSDCLWLHGLQHARLPCSSPSPGVYSNLCPLSRWGHPTISFSVALFSSCPQSFPASESFPMSQLSSPGKPKLNHVVLGLVTQSCLTLCDPIDCSPQGSSVHRNSPGKNTGEACHSILQGIFPNQGSEPALLHCRWILYHLSHQRTHG